MKPHEGTKDRPLRVAIIGAGPAGLYTADALTIASDVAVQVDVMERLPVPFGLLRYGVAPDHTNIKLASGTLQDVLDRPNVHLLCNVELGRDVTVDLLRQEYDAIVYATGADADKNLSIPGEELPGSASATSFVRWYNGHPDAETFDLSTIDEVAVVGAGNVALDVTRMLTKDPNTLRQSDIAQNTLDVLAASAVTDVHVVVRRGAEHTKFTTRELRELGALDGVDVLVDPDELPPEGIEGLGTVAKRNLTVLRDWAVRERTDAPRRIHFHFSTRPSRIIGDRAVHSLRVERAGRTDDIPVRMVLRAVGYRSRPIDGVAFSTDTSTIPHRDHRVVHDGNVRVGEYAVGWAKRGPTGVLGTNRSDAEATAAEILADRRALLTRHRHASGSVRDWLEMYGTTVLDNDSWSAIDAREIELGRSTGRPRMKIDSWKGLLAAGSHVYIPS